MRPRGLRAASVLLALSFGSITALQPLLGHFISVASSQTTGTRHGPRDLQLEVFLNGASTQLIAAFREEADGRLLIDPDQLRNVGLRPAEAAAGPDGLIDIARLPNVSFEVDEATQSIHFAATYGALAPHIVDLGLRTGADRAEAESSVGALVNYTVFGSTGGGIEKIWSFEGASAWLEGRAFSPLGVLTSSHVLSTSPDDLYGTKRLDTFWSYSSPASLTSYRAGDIVTGGLAWTRPVRLGGVQTQRNFGLRPDLVTMPLPELSGSAAVPSTVDVYVSDTRRLSRDVPSGPFQIVNLPTVSGAGTARIVVRDALGRETISETPFYASSDLLRAGLVDFSAEAGFARRFYGTRSDDYDGRLLASGTVRYGLSDRLTLEGHAEGGGGLTTGGAGAVFQLGSFGVGSLSGAASRFRGSIGFQAAASVELELRGGVHLFARTQRSFGDYHDIGSITFEPPSRSDPAFITALPLRSLNQLSLSFPLLFDPATLSLSYTDVEPVGDDRSRIIGISLDRPFGQASTFFANAAIDLDDTDSAGVFVGISMPLGDQLYASSGASTDAQGTTVTTELVRPETGEVGSVGWRVRDTEGTYANRAASLSYRARTGRYEAGVQQHQDRYRAAAQADGAVVFAGGDIFLSGRVDDAFAIVDVGAPGVDVEYENRPAGRTDRRGKLLLPDLRSYEPNRITIDPANLPLGAVVDGTRRISIPADRSGTVVRFGVQAEAQSALVTLRDEAGLCIEVGATGAVEGSPEPFTVGYDGQAYITGLGPRNRVVVDQPSRGRCVAEFPFQPQEGEQVFIPDAVCRPAG